MKNLLRVFFIVFFVSTSSNIANAKSGQTSFGIELGFGFADIGAEETAQAIANLSGSTTTVTYDTGALAGRIYLEYGLSNELSIDAGYIMSGDIDATYTLNGASATESYSVSGLDAALSYSPPGQGFFFKGGFHSSEIEGNASVTVGGTTYAATASASGEGYLVGAGFDFSDNSRVGYTYYANMGGDAEADVGFLYYGYRF